MYDRRNIMLRAHQLRRWNRGPASQGQMPPDLARWLRMAWAEAKAGTLPSFAPSAIRVREVEAIEDTITCLEQRDRLFPADYRRMTELRLELQSAVDQAVAATRPEEIRLSDLTHDPVLAAIFRRNERDDLAGAKIDRPRSPAPTMSAAADRELEMA